jgi:hypothetical protein
MQRPGMVIGGKMEEMAGKGEAKFGEFERKPKH